MKENYLVQDYTKRGKVFATLEEASAYREDLAKQIRIIYAVIRTKRKVTHTYPVN